MIWKAQIVLDPYNISCDLAFYLILKLMENVVNFITMFISMIGISLLNSTALPGTMLRIISPDEAQFCGNLWCMSLWAVVDMITCSGPNLREFDLSYELGAIVRTCINTLRVVFGPYIQC